MFSRKCVFSELKNGTTPSVFCTWLCYEVISAVTLFQNDAKLQSIENWLSFGRHLKILRFSLKSVSRSEGCPQRRYQRVYHVCICTLQFFPCSRLLVLWRSQTLHRLVDRFDSTNSMLLRGYWADSQRRTFWTRGLCSTHQPKNVWNLFLFSLLGIPQLKALALVKTWWLVSLNFCTIWDAMELHFPSVRNLELHTTSFHLQVQRMSNVLAKISSRTAWLFLNSKYTFHQYSFLFIRCH